MLEELRNLNYRGGKDGLLFFLQKVLGNTSKSATDIKIICSHGLNGQFFSADELIQYCLAFNWIEFHEGYYSTSPILVNMMSLHNNANACLIELTVNRLFDDNVFTPDMFTYDAVSECFCLNNEMLDLSFSTVRNVLSNQGFFIVLRDNTSTRFSIDSQYEFLIARQCKEKRKRLSLKQLEEKMEKNKEAGEKAELFVLKFEQKRLGAPLDTKVKRISEIDVTAGYDIVSFQSNKSFTHDCFIEVKAISNDYGFFWSRNEYETAKLKGSQYYLYLVKLSQINNPNYSPDIIQNPASQIMDSNSWLVESQSYYIKKAN